MVFFRKMNLAKLSSVMLRINKLYLSCVSLIYLGYGNDRKVDAPSKVNEHMKTPLEQYFDISLPSGFLYDFVKENSANYPNPRYIFPGGRSMKTSQIPMFLDIAAWVWGQRWHA